MIGSLPRFVSFSVASGVWAMLQRCRRKGRPPPSLPCEDVAASSPGTIVRGVARDWKDVPIDRAELEVDGSLLARGRHVVAVSS